MCVKKKERKRRFDECLASNSCTNIESYVSCVPRQTEFLYIIWQISKKQEYTPGKAAAKFVKGIKVGFMPIYTRFRYDLMPS